MRVKGKVGIAGGGPKDPRLQSRGATVKHVPYGRGMSASECGGLLSISGGKI